MSIRQIGFSWFLVASLAAGASAQQPGVAVQLPTFSFFTVTTTVVVPDSGAGIAAAMKRARSARNLSGLPLGRKHAGGIGAEAQAAGLHVHAAIHDQQEMDEAVLAEAEKKARRPRDELTLRMRDTQDDSAGQAQLSLNEIRRRKAEAAEVQDQEGLAQLNRGKKAEKAGKANVARLYYQTAARRLTGKLKQEALDRLAVLGEKKPAPQVARKAPQR